MSRICWGKHRLTVVVALLLAGCAAERSRVREVTSRVGVEVEPNVGFFAFTTELPSVDPESVTIEVASADSLRGARVLPELDDLLVYRRAVATYVNPEALSALLRDSGYRVVTTLDPDPITVVGSVYVGLRAPPIPPMLPRPRGHPSGVDFVSIPEGPLRGDLQKKIEDLVERAARYGGNALVDLRVLFNSENSTEYVYIPGVRPFWVLRADVMRLREP